MPPNQLSTIDVCLVSGRRPPLLAKTLKSFQKHLFRHFQIANFWVNLDPFGGGEKEHAECRRLILDYFPKAIISEPTEPGFGLAVKNLWSQPTSPYFLHIEDDWIIHEDLSPEDLAPLFDRLTKQVTLLNVHKSRKNNSLFDYQRTRRWFWPLKIQNPNKPLFTTSPSFLETAFAKESASLMDPELDPEKQFYNGFNLALQKFSQPFRNRFLIGKRDPNIISDIGRNWRDKLGIEKETINGVSQWTNKTENRGHHPSDRITVIISTYNDAQYIDKKINEVRSQSNFAHCDFIFIETGSPQKERELLKPFCDQHPNCYLLTTDERRSLYEAWNMGWQLAKTKYLCISNMDDTMHPNLLREITKKMVTEDLDLSTVLIAKQKLSDPLRDSWEPSRLKELPLARRPGPFFAWKNDLKDNFGLFDEAFLVAGDKDFWARAGAAGLSIGHIPKVLYQFTLHEGQLSSSARAEVTLEKERQYASTKNYLHDWPTDLIKALKKAERTRHRKGLKSKTFYLEEI